MKSICFFIVCSLSITGWAQDEYDRIVEERHLIEAIEKHHAEQLRKAEDRYSKMHPQSSGRAKHSDFWEKTTFIFLVTIISLPLLALFGSPRQSKSDEAPVKDYHERKAERVAKAKRIAEANRVAKAKRVARSRRANKLRHLLNLVAFWKPKFASPQPKNLDAPSKARPELSQSSVPTPESLADVALKGDVQLKSTEPENPRGAYQKSKKAVSLKDIQPELLIPPIPTLDSFDHDAKNKEPQASTKLFETKSEAKMIFNYLGR